jgi:hypothetical protein
MGVPFTKLFSSITTSTIWREDDHTRIVWITMLAMADKNGQVISSVPGLADMARVPLGQTVKSLEKLSSPDEWSSSQEFEGRRIEKIDRGWKLLNYAKFRAMREVEERREYMKGYMRDYRKNAVNKVSNVSSSKPGLAQAEAEAEAEAVRTKPPASQVEEIYQLYPRKMGKREALKAITAAIKRVEGGEYRNVKRTETEAIAGIKGRTDLFARSAAGNRGKFTPHPATWFNRSGYLDDPKEWYVEDTGIRKSEQRANDNQTAIVDGLNLSREVDGSGRHIQDGTDVGRNPRLEKFLRG